MAKVLVEEENLQNIADTIRAKNKSSETYYPRQMASAIAELSNLPDVTPSDEGKVLAVDSNGDWAAESPLFVTGTDAQVADAVSNYLNIEGVPSLQPEAADSVADAVIGAPGFEEQITEAVDAWIAENPPDYGIDPTLSVSGEAADAKATGDKFDDLKSDLSVGRVEITKAVTWSNGYVNTSGVVKSSTLSGYAIVSMQAGEMVVIGTQNSNITIIGSTESESVAVGDSVTVIQTTSSTNQYEEYSYTATSDINIVICVLLSNYNLHFYYKLIHTDDAFTPTIKNALLACFQNVAWANDNGLQYLNALNKALNGGKIPVTGGKFYPNLAVSASNNEASLYYDASTYNRLGFALDGVGDHPMKMSSQNPTTQDSFYPIPVPADALQFKATTPSSISISGYFFKWTGKWTVQLSLGNWSANYGGTTADILSINDGNLYFACGFRNSSNNGNITSVDTSTLQLEWLN